MEASAARRPSRVRTTAPAVIVVIVGYIVSFIATSDDPRDPSGNNWVLIGIAAAAAALILSLIVAPTLARHEGNTPAKVGLVAGLLALPSILLFWTGLPLLLGAAALVLGFEGRVLARRGAGRAVEARAATLLGAVLCGGWFVVMLIIFVGEM